MHNLRKLPIHITLFVLVLSGFLFMTRTSFADDPCKDISDLDDRAECYENEIKKNEDAYASTSKKLSDIRSKKDSVNGKINDLLSQLTVSQSQLDDLQADIDDMTRTLEEIAKALEEKNAQLSDKLALRNKVVRNYVKKGVLNDLELLLNSNESNLTGFQYSSMSYIFGKTLNGEALRLIGLISEEITSFENDKRLAEELKSELVASQQSLLSAIATLESEKKVAQTDLSSLASKEEGYEKELKSLSEKISDLSSKQQEVLKKKFGDSYGSVGDYESPDWSVPSPPFKPAFAAFSYGAYTHYRGMSQYGAKGRAEAGQDYEDIIKFYYKKDVKEDDDLPDEICVEGYGTISFQYYLYGLAEMPSDWPEDALKAQAIAARTYAYRYHKNGKCICTSQSCQVFLKSKADNPPSRWKKAVDDTKDEIISGDTHAMYSSTTGGFIDDGVGWDKDGSWPNNAYEKKANSPWFYWAWYTSNYRFDSDTCGHPHPWLTQKEMADIVNSWVVWDRGSGSDRSHISPVTTNCWGGDPYSHGEMADKAADLWKKFDKVIDVDVEIGNNGKTVKVTLQTDNGSLEIDGEEFKTVFNLRAPSYISIRSRLFDFQVKN